MGHCMKEVTCPPPSLAGCTQEVGCTHAQSQKQRSRLHLGLHCPASVYKQERGVACKRYPHSPFGPLPPLTQTGQHVWDLPRPMMLPLFLRDRGPFVLTQQGMGWQVCVSQPPPSDVPFMHISRAHEWQSPHPHLHAKWVQGGLLQHYAPSSPSWCPATICL